MPTVVDQKITSPQPAAATGFADYSGFIAELEQKIEDARTSQRSSPEPRFVAIQSMRIDQLRLGIENAKEAQTIPATRNEDGSWSTPEMHQFGCASRIWNTRVAPALEDYEGRLRHIRGQDFRYVTDNPIEIAWLRRLVRNHALEGMAEVPVGYAYARPVGNIGEAEWMPGDDFLRRVGNRMVQ